MFSSSDLPVFGIPPTLGAWRGTPIRFTTEQAEDQRALLAFKADLERGLAELLALVRSGELDHVRLERAVITAQQHAAELDAFDSKAIHPMFYNERHQDSSTIAHRVFDVVEVLEMILTHLEIPDVLIMSQVNHSIRRAIGDSTKPQMKLLLRPAPADSHVYTPFASGLVASGGFSCLVFPAVVHRDRFNNTIPESAGTSLDNVVSSPVTAQFYPYIGQRLPRIGSTYRRMFCCQSPIQRMAAYMRCYNEGRPGDDLPRNKACTVTVESGVTIGHLYDHAKKLMVRNPA